MDNVELVFKIVEELIGRDLSAIEKFVVRGSLLSQTYSQMSEEINYGAPHLKDVGSKLWIELSKIFGERVSKKNLKIILTNYLQEDLLSYLATNKQPKLHTIGESKFSDDFLGDRDFIYVERPPIEDLACREIEVAGCLIRILAPRKMGKSSLLAKIIVRARELDYITVKVDLLDADLDIIKELDRLLRWLCLNIGRFLGIKSQINFYWDREIGSKVSCQLYLERHLLTSIDRPLVLVIKNIDRVFEFSEIAQDFLLMLRSWHERSKYSQVWQKLRLVISHSTKVYVPLKLHQSPFNVGLSLKLPSFSFEQVQELALHYELEWLTADPENLESLFSLVGGHPYLLNIAFHNLSLQKISLEKLLDKAPTNEGVYSHNLRGIWAILQREPNLMMAFQQLLNSEASPELEKVTAYKLQSLGLIIPEEDHYKISCRLYQLYFQRRLKAFTNSTVSEQYLEKNLEETDPQHKFFIDLNNQNYLYSYLSSEWQNWIENSQYLSLVICDIECFRFYSKTINEDLITKIIQEIAQVKSSLISHHESKNFSIVVPNELAIVLPNTELETAKLIADNLRKQLIKQLEASFLGKNVIITDNHSKFSQQAKASKQDGIISLAVVSVCPSPSITPKKLIVIAKQTLAESRQQRSSKMICRKIASSSQVDL